MPDLAVVHHALPGVLLTPFSIRHPRTSKGIAVPDHAHDEGMLVLVHAGLVLVQAGSQVWTVLPGSLGWIPPGVQHAARWFGEARGSFLYVRADACERLPDHCRSWPSSRLIDALIERFTTSQAGELSEAYLAQLFDVLLAEITQRDHAPMLLPMPDDPRLQDLANSLLGTPDDPSGIDDWAQRLNMSPRTLMRRFRQETGVTLGQWRQQARLLRALEMLCRGDSVTEAALAVGYESTSAFIGSFRGAFGMTPTRYLAGRE
ncbi:MAG: AraC family transcriptional regulator [Achromobacter pulmonis]|uniref:helix-turn-helix transcriptional regulator n=1 Tax=Achromobacter pulmonis TaxID=1389932 RepID=UPI0012CD84CE|nr:AraC family transcriptional regulator [Achromobacter pulmonis]MCF7766822.1 AraC family transcriptional regulator [Achromobacter pulmonis]MPT28271.1 AraC family transcriptional regulator [Achromobacter sp.]CAB3673434.1 HTH-type transcriptional regulator NimR [Achromobacter pulmonis]